MGLAFGVRGAVVDHGLRRGGGGAECPQVAGIGKPLVAYETAQHRLFGVRRPGDGSRAGIVLVSSGLLVEGIGMGRSAPKATRAAVVACSAINVWRGGPRLRPLGQTPPSERRACFIDRHLVVVVRSSVVTREDHVVFSCLAASVQVGCSSRRRTRRPAKSVVTDTRPPPRPGSGPSSTPMPCSRTCIRDPSARAQGVRREAVRCTGRACGRRRRRRWIRWPACGDIPRCLGAS